MKKVILSVVLLTSVWAVPTVCMTPISRGAIAGAAIGAAIGSSYGTFTVINDYIDKDVLSATSFWGNSRGERAQVLLENGSLFEIIGYAAVGAVAGAVVGATEGAIVSGLIEGAKLIADDVKKDGIRSKTIIGVAGISAVAFVAYALQQNNGSSQRTSTSYENYSRR